MNCTSEFFYGEEQEVNRHMMALFASCPLRPNSGRSNRCGNAKRKSLFYTFYIWVLARISVRRVTRSAIAARVQQPCQRCPLGDGTPARRSPRSPPPHGPPGQDPQRGPATGRTSPIDRPNIPAAALIAHWCPSARRMTSTPCGRASTRS